ncbi:helix-turn-helix domain-containing protein [Thermomonas sp. XSG]|uniref:MerR family transcriptional regulator n=1 Tax=Thermomonas sp. XSG TaxID=2771436 RepID=UPI00086F5F30|nr:helix-turn-helix domain-containing protein [Thermomonas sp. XSG]ODU53326.1 MAG: MerR family transcriptional regulator [Xanthomonadaceae bacterium SCN 69-48]QNU15499.1 helix-turn-helix domain-containing protein [Thermomonas sp. XSG]
MKISEASQASGCHLETIRYYERIGLMPSPTRTGSGYRSYSEQDVERLRFITRGRDLGFSLDEIRSLMRLDQNGDLACEDVTRLAQQHLIDVQERIRDLQRVARELERTIRSCGGGVRAQCAILDALKHSPAPGEAA